MNEYPLTQNIRANHEPLSLTQYETQGGYESLRTAINRMSPQDVQNLVTDSSLRGRGGAGFPTGKKWSFVPVESDTPHPKYIIANADEMEPGSFKDRLLLEGDPHQLIEGMIVSAYAIQANVGYIFLRWAYKLSELRLKRAISEAYQNGYLGPHILGSTFNFDLYVHTSAGRYICGEETALLNALEGKPAIPRAKPPYPQISGLWGKPTIVQNVETLCNVPHIINRGAEWYRKLGLGKDGGTKIYGISGKVRRPGLWELPIGTPLREILMDYAGGMQDGLKFRGALPGGASTAFLTEQHLDLPLDFESVPEAGSRLGTATIIVLDHKTCPVAFIRNLEHFFAQESCGWCTPCREGLPWTERLLLELEEGRGIENDLQTLEQQTKFLGPGNTFCAHAPGAMAPLQSGLKYFKDDFARHIREQRCPWST